MKGIQESEKNQKRQGYKWIMQMNWATLINSKDLGSLFQYSAGTISLIIDKNITMIQALKN